MIFKIQIPIPSFLQQNHAFPNLHSWHKLDVLSTQANVETVMEFCISIMKIDIYQMTRDFLLGQNRLFLGLAVLVILVIIVRGVCPNSLNFRFVNVLFNVWKMKQFESKIEILCPVLLRSPSTQCPVIKLLQVAGSITGCVSLQLDHNQAATLPTGEILSGKKNILKI